MRILLTAHNLVPASYAGVEIHTHELACALVERGHEVTVAVPAVEALRAATPPYRLKLIEGCPNWVVAENWPAKERKALWAKFQAIVDEVNPELIHAQHMLHLGWQWLDELKRMGRPHVVTLMDYWTICPGIFRLCRGSHARCRSECAGASWRRPWSMLRARRRQKEMLKSMNASPAPLAPNSPQAADIFISSGVQPNRLVPMALGSAMKPLSVETLRHAAPLRYAYIGTVSPHKGAETLMRAWQKSSNGGQLTIHGTGDSSYLIALQRLARGTNIRFAGRYSHSEIGKILSENDVIIVPSLWEESYGLTVQEALVAGRTVIASETGGIPGRIIHGLNGLLFPPGDADALAACLRQVSDQWDHFRARENSDFGIHRMEKDVEDWEDLYRWTISEWKGLNSGQVAPVEWMLRRDARTVAEFTGRTEAAEHERLLAEHRDPGSTVGKAWNAGKPQTAEEVTNFYRNTDSYLYDLLVVRHSQERRIWREEALQLLVKYGAKSMLDYGGGCGTDAILFARAGMKVTLFDVGTQNLGLARHRAAKAGVHFETTGEFPEGGVFDAVHCTEVLEHVPDPIGVMQRILSVLRPGGVALVTHSFDLIEEKYPSHLPEHRGLSVTFIGRIQELGAEYVETVEVPCNRYLVFRRPAEVNGTHAAQLQETAAA